MNKTPKTLDIKNNLLCPEPDYQPLRLHADQIIIEVMAYMNTTGEQCLPVYDDNNTYLGNITYGEIMKFLEHEADKNLYYHKLNYTMESLLVLKKGILNHLFIDDNSPSQ